MKAIKCAKCQKFTPGDMPQCLGCGAALITASPPDGKFNAPNMPPIKTVANPMSEDPIRCVKCRSHQISANKKGFGLGKAVAGGVTLGLLGLLGGLIGASKVKITYLKCGHSWQAGKH